MWFRESNRYFCKVENFAYGEINERSFCNPHRCAGCSCCWREPNALILKALHRLLHGLSVGLGHLAFDLFYSNGYVNGGNVAAKCWFSRASHEHYITWAERERNLKYFNTSVAKCLCMIVWYINSTRADGRFCKPSNISYITAINRETAKSGLYVETWPRSPRHDHQNVWFSIFPTIDALHYLGMSLDCHCLGYYPSTPLSQSSPFIQSSNELQWLKHWEPKWYSQEWTPKRHAPSHQYAHNTK